MSNELKEMFEIIQRRGLNLSKFSKEIGIPVDRIYQWKKGNGKPKAEDAEKIKKWLNNPEEITRETLTTEQDVVQAASIKVLFNEVAKIKARIFNMEVEDVIKEFEQDTRIIIKGILKDSEHKV